MGSIYAIRHDSTNRMYVGSTVNSKQRKTQHFSDLRCGRHYNPYLQRAFVKYGENKFSFLILEECEDNLLAVKEKEWIHLKRSNKKEFGFNCTDEPYAPMRGKKHNADTLAKMRASQRRGEEHQRSKYTEEQVREVFQLYYEGNSQLRIEDITGMDSTNISLILRGKAWSHLGLGIKKERLNNKSGCVGVYLHKSGKWKAEIIKVGKYIDLGYHADKEDAIAARKRAEGGGLSDTK